MAASEKPRLWLYHELGVVDSTGGRPACAQLRARAPAGRCVANGDQGKSRTRVRPRQETSSSPKGQMATQLSRPAAVTAPPCHLSY